MKSRDTIDFDRHWAQSLDTYRTHPTSRHRRRFIMRTITKDLAHPHAFFFDYGCGTGILLNAIRERYALADTQFGGCDLSSEAIKASRKEILSPYFYNESFPEIDRPIDFAVASEVIEHTPDYEEILSWLWRNLRTSGLLAVTTPGGRMDPPDVYYGHTQHFRLQELAQLLERIGFSLRIARYWGFPFFNLQKWITRRNFDNIREQYMTGGLNTKKRILFNLSYYLYFIHDLIPFGPQIFILAQKSHGASAIKDR